MDVKLKVAMIAGLEAAGWSEEEIDASVSRCAKVWAAAEVPVRTAPEGQLGGAKAQRDLADAIGERIGAAWLSAELDRVGADRALHGAARNAWDAEIAAAAERADAAAQHESW